MIHPSSYIAALRESRNRRKCLLEQEGLFRCLKTKSGFVLITVLIVSALLITVSGEFLINAQNNINYMSNFKAEAQSMELARTGIDAAVFILETDKTGRSGSVMSGLNTNSAIDSYNDLWAMDIPTLPIDSGAVKIVIGDEQSKINLSVLANEVGETRYYPITKRLLESMGFLPDICDCIKDWVDPDSQRSPYGAETFDYYSTLPKPRTAKNGPLDSIDELMMIKGITPQIFYGLGGGNIALERNLVPDNKFIKKMSLDQTKNQDTTIDMAEVKTGKEKSRDFRDYFRAHGGKDYSSNFNKININTASFRILSALTEKMTDVKVTELIRHRIEHPYATVDEALKVIGDDTIKDYISVSSDVFSLQATGIFNGLSVTVYAIYNRSDKHYYYYGIQ